MYSQILPGKAVACLRHLPSPLIAARAEVFNPLNCLDLNQTARRVLFGILTFVSLRSPRKAIWPKRDTLRAESHLQSLASCYRGLKLLEVFGYIERAQERSEYSGKFKHSPIRLTEKALALLGLDKVIHKRPSIKMEDGHIKKELTKSEQSLKNTTGKPESLDTSEIDRNTGLPKELVGLLELGVDKAAICWLMKTAKTHGKRLGDVVHVVRHRIEALRGREVVAYLKSMLGKELDFGWMAKAKLQDAASQHAHQAAQARLESLNARYDGFEVIGEGGAVIGKFEASATPGTLHVIRTHKGSCPVNLRFAMDLAEGRYFLRPSAAATSSAWQFS